LLEPLSLEATPDGGEPNVAVALANRGFDARFVTDLPGSDIADACIRDVRSIGVYVSCICRSDGGTELHFMQTGASRHPGEFVYVRANSAIAVQDSGVFDCTAHLQRCELVSVSSWRGPVSKSVAKAGAGIPGRSSTLRVGSSASVAGNWSRLPAIAV
jgi:2-dehydro-3-deoxygluconokinase